MPQPSVTPPAAQVRIVIAGNIGAGKSTLAEILGKELGWPVELEAAAANPYLADFYHDMPRWALHSQLFFLAERIRREARRQATATGRGQLRLIEDRCIHEDAEVFARNLAVQGVINARDWDLYWTIYEAATELGQAPNLIVWLDAPVDRLLANIARRGRPFERQLPEGYLTQLQERYQEWAQDFVDAPILRIDMTNLDFVANSADCNQVIAKVRAKLEQLELL